MPALPEGDPLGDDDLQLALYLCYELHYRGLPDVDDAWEWEPSLIALRGRLERVFEDGLRRAVGQVALDLPAHETDLALRDVIAADDGPSLSMYLVRHGTLAQVLEFVVHRSAYQLKEADPHSWALPRLSGAPEGGAGGGAGGRVRRWSSRSHPRRAVREDDGGARTRSALRRLPRPHSRRDARNDSTGVVVA